MLIKNLAALFLFGAAAFAQPPATISAYFEREIAGVESEVVPLAEAMPPGKYDFVPTAGDFKTVRSFALQVRHIATVNYEVASAALGVECPVAKGTNENGADTLKTKAEIVQYLKDSFAYAHKAAKTVTAANLMEPVKSPFGEGQMSRVAAVSIVTSHTFDHYGQMAIFARMNGVVPPASK